MSVETLLVFINGASSTQLCFTWSFLTTSPRSSLLLRCLEFCHRPKCPSGIEWVQSSPPPSTHISHYVPFQQFSGDLFYLSFNTRHARFLSHPS